MFVALPGIPAFGRAVSLRAPLVSGNRYGIPASHERKAESLIHCRRHFSVVPIRQ